MRYLFFLIFISYTYLLANAHIFVYHKFGDNKSKSTNTSIEELRKEFQYFKDNNYKVVPIEDILTKLEKKEKIPDNWVALTIDDAYKSFYENGLEVFKEFGYPFALYVYVEATDRRYGNFMTWEQIKEADKYGTIGLHSYSHPHLTKLPLEEVRKDTQKSFDIFTKRMGYKPESYAYPYGEYNDEVKKVISSFGFKAIFNQSTGSVNDKSDLNDIYRIALVGDVNLKVKLRYKTLEAKWIEPKEFPKSGVLKKVKAKVDPKIKNLKLYITSEGWKDIKVKNGLVDVNLNTYLKRARTRIMLGTDVFTISNKIIIKD
jgi:peptidoglycan/xylan/chitin deacetylase (PgdA/CDA1 family)